MVAAAVLPRTAEAFASEVVPQAVPLTLHAPTRAVEPPFDDAPKYDPPLVDADPPQNLLPSSSKTTSVFVEQDGAKVERMNKLPSCKPGTLVLVPPEQAVAGAAMETELQAASVRAKIIFFMNVSYIKWAKSFSR
jgi:hypothetical protein